MHRRWIRSKGISPLKKESLILIPHYIFFSHSIFFSCFSQRICSPFFQKNKKIVFPVCQLNWIGFVYLPFVLPVPFRWGKLIIIDDIFMKLIFMSKRKLFNNKFTYWQEHKITPIHSRTHISVYLKYALKWKTNFLEWISWSKVFSYGNRKGKSYSSLKWVIQIFVFPVQNYNSLLEARSVTIIMFHLCVGLQWLGFLVYTQEHVILPCIDYRCRHRAFGWKVSQKLKII